MWPVKSKPKGEKTPKLSRKDRRDARAAARHSVPDDAVLLTYAPSPNAISQVRLRRWVWVILLVYCFLQGLFFAFFAPFLMVGFAVPIAVLGVICIWALPEARTAPSGVLVKLLFAFVVLLIGWPNYIALALPGLPWITMERLTGVPLTIILLICISISQPFRRDLAAPLKTSPLIWFFLRVFVALQILSIVFSKEKSFSIDKFVVDQTGWTAIFVASTFAFLKPGRAELMAYVLWGMAIFVGAIGIAEYLGHHVLWAGHIPSFLQINDPIVMDILGGKARGGAYRAVSTFSSPLGLGEYMGLTMPIVLHFALGKYSMKIRVAATATVPFMLVGAFASGSRLGQISCLLAIMFYGAVWAVLKWRRDRGSLLGPAITIAYPALSLIAITAVMFIGRIHNIVLGDGSEIYSNQARQGQVEMGIPLILHHPWGYGLGMGGSTLNFRPFGFMTIDNYYLSIVLEYGVLGFIVYYGMFITAAYTGLRMAIGTARFASRELELVTAISITMINFFLIKSVYSQEDNHPLIFMLLGMLVALIHRVKSTAAAAAPALAATAPHRGRALAGRGSRLAARR